jgi:membrane-associated protein
MPLKEGVKKLLDLLLHFDKHLAYVLQQSGAWTYAILFGIVFCETGLVVTPFLPGDSLLFVVGAFCATGALSPWWASAVLILAAVLGDSANYAVGRYFGARLVARHSRLVSQERLERTHEFFRRYGGKTIVLARFVPMVRTFAPFVAGLGRMDYRKFFFYNVAGGVLWVGLFIAAGFFFGNLPLVKDNMSLVIFLIVVISVIPAVIEFFKAKAKR